MKVDVQNDLTQKFSKGTIITHWLSTVLILVLFPLGKYMEGNDGPEKLGLIKIHAILGIILFVLTAIRTYLFFKAPRPENLKTGSNFNDKLVVWIHNIFYFLLFGIIISGVATMKLGGYAEAMISGNKTLLESHGELLSLEAHELMSMVLMILLLVHVFGVIKHYLLTKENTIRRICQKMD